MDGGTWFLSILGISGGGGGASDWASITGKPSTFAPSAHTHPASDVVSGVLDPSRYAPTEEVPSGTVDGANTVFTISRNATLVMVIVGGQVLNVGSGFTRLGTSITLAYAPESSNYFKAILFG